MKFLFAIVMCSFVLVTQCFAEQRYSITKLSDGTLRLDHQTGAVSYCREKEGKLICSLAADERQAWIAETEELAKRIERLQERIQKLETTSNEEPSSNQAMDFMKNAMRRFSDLFKDLKTEQQ